MVADEQGAELGVGVWVGTVLAGETFLDHDEPGVGEGLTEALLVERVRVHLVLVIHEIDEKPDQAAGAEEAVHLGQDGRGIVHVVETVLDNDEVAARGGQGDALAAGAEEGDVAAFLGDEPFGEISLGERIDRESPGPAIAAEEGVWPGADLQSADVGGPATVLVGGEIEPRGELVVPVLLPTSVDPLEGAGP